MDVSLSEEGGSCRVRRKAFYKKYPIKREEPAVLFTAGDYEKNFIKL